MSESAATAPSEARQPNLPPQPRRGAQGFPIAPMLYPRLLRQAANALDALVAFEDPDPTNREAPHFVGSYNIALPLYDEERGENPELVGWLSQEDAACWVFVPYVPEIEASDA